MKRGVGITLGFNKRPYSVKLLIFLHIFLGLGAIYGGFSLIISPEGNTLNLSISNLENSPFDSFFIPGILLFIVLGLFPLLVAWFLFENNKSRSGDLLNIFRDKHWSWGFSLYVGFALIIWITVQMYFLQVVGSIHLFYITLGLLILIITLWPTVQKYYSI